MNGPTFILCMTILLGLGGSHASTQAAAPGEKLWEFSGEGYFFSSPAIASDGAIYVGCYDKKVYALPA